MLWRWHHFDHLTYRMTLLLKCRYFHLPADVPRPNAPELVTAHCSSHRRAHHSLPPSPALLYPSSPLLSSALLCSPLRLCLLFKRVVYIHERAQTASSQENGKGIRGVGEQEYSCEPSPLGKKKNAREDAVWRYIAVRKGGEADTLATSSKRSFTRRGFKEITKV